MTARESFEAASRATRAMRAARAELDAFEDGEWDGAYKSNDGVGVRTGHVGDPTAAAARCRQANGPRLARRYDLLAEAIEQAMAVVRAVATHSQRRAAACALYYLSESAGEKPPTYEEVARQLSEAEGHEVTPGAARGRVRDACKWIDSHGGWYALARA